MDLCLEGACTNAVVLLLTRLLGLLSLLPSFETLAGLRNHEDVFGVIFEA
jgi:hypothetical protein